MINSKYVPPHRRDTKEEPKKEAKEIKEVVASIKTKEESPLVKTKNKPMIAPKSRSGCGRLQRHLRALVQSEARKKSSHGL